MILAYLLSAAADGNGVKDTVDTIADTHDQIILALIAIIGASVGALVYIIKNNILNKENNTLNKAIAKDAAQINAAVNHKETGELSLYRLAASNRDVLQEVIAKLDDVVSKQSEFDRKWGNLPPEIGDAVALNEVLHDINQSITRIQGELLEHVKWEMAQKYPQS